MEFWREKTHFWGAVTAKNGPFRPKWKKTENVSYLLFNSDIGKQAGAALGKVQVKLDDIVEVVVDVVVMAVVQVEV